MTNFNPNDEFNHTDSQNTPSDRNRSEGTPAIYRPYKKGISAKGVIAIILSCAIIFSAIGFGSAWIIAGSRQTGEPAGSSASASDTAESGKPVSSSEIQLKVANEEENALTVPEIVDKAADSVVEITTETVETGNMLQQYISSGAGSGVIISEDGYIITNHHVIEDATSINVTLRSGETYPAVLIGLDDQLDMALLKIDASGLKPATIGTSSDLVVGQTVVAIGNPLGQLGGTVTNGIISALNRNITMDGQTMNLLQTDAAVNPGNSGGGLFNAQGNLIALVVAKSTGDGVEGLGFAIPIDHVIEVLDDLKEHGYVTGRVSLGISLIDINSDQMAWMYRVEEKGTYVYSVTTGSAADDAGLHAGDRLVSVDGTEIGSISELKEYLQTVSVGDSLSFVISRSGQNQTVTVIAGEYVPEEIQNAAQNSPASYRQQQPAQSGDNL